MTAESPPRTPVCGMKDKPLCPCSCMINDEDTLMKHLAPRTSYRTLESIDATLYQPGTTCTTWEDSMDRGSSMGKEVSDVAHKTEEDLLKTMDHVPYERINVQIEIGKLKKLLEGTLNMLNFAMCVPQFVENDYCILRSLLPETEVNQIKTLLDPINFKTCSLFGVGEYEFRRTNFFTESSASCVEKLYSEYKEKDRDLSSRKEIEDIWTAIDILYEHTKYEPRLFTTEMIMKIPEHNKDVIEALKNVFKHVLTEITMSPKQAEEQEIELSRMFMAFEQLGNEMVSLHSRLRPAIEENLLRIVTVCKEVQSLKDQKKKLREFLEHSHQRIRNNLEKNTMMYNLEAMKTTKEKMGPRKELITKHQHLVKEDLAEEKTLRVKKYKIEQVLQGIINKYEEDMADRNKKLAHLNEMYDMEMAQMKQMQERFDAQEKVYDLLMEEKAKYEQSVWDAKLRGIQRKIAARKIQRFYRGYLAFMQAHGRKKGKGKGKGKKRS